MKRKTEHTDVSEEMRTEEGSEGNVFGIYLGTKGLLLV